MYLGVDSGGTKTLVAIVDGYGELRGVGRAPSGNIDDLGFELAKENIHTAIREACQNADIRPENIQAAFFSMAGVVSEKDRAAVMRIARGVGSFRVGIDHDLRSALAGGLSGRPGIVLIAGTGASCFGINQRGESWRAGGWGDLMADEGSAGWLGREALVAAVRDVDGRGQQTMLKVRLFAHLGVDDPNDIMHRVYVEGLSRADLAALAPLVVQVAAAGDKVATHLMQRGANELITCVATVAERLSLPANCQLTVVGGLTKAGDSFWQPFRRALKERLPDVQLTEPEMPPVLGACLLALELDGKLCPQTLQTLQAISHPSL